jgi:glycosyltransferase involved in cell wall biosynthesis
MKKLSIIIPAYNEEKTILTLLERVNAQSLPGMEMEIIVVDDGSKDSTAALLDANPNFYTNFIKQPRNQGKGAAVLAALRAATGDYVLFQDADLEYDPAEYPVMCEPVLAHGAEIVMGSRFVAPRMTRVAYFWNKVGNRLITLMFNVLNNTTFSDIYSCYMMFRRDLLDISRLKTRGWEQHAEILSLIVGRTDAIYEVPISYHGRSKKEGKKIRAHHVIPVLWIMMVRRFFK